MGPVPCCGAFCSTEVGEKGESRICCNPMNPMLWRILSHRCGGEGESRMCCNPMNPKLRRILSRCVCGVSAVCVLPGGGG